MFPRRVVACLVGLLACYSGALCAQELKWSVTLNRFHASCMVKDAAGDVHICGPVGYFPSVIKLDATGKMVKATSLGGNDFYVLGMSAWPDGAVVVSGCDTSFNNTALVKVDADGKLLWKKWFTYSSCNVVPGPDGTLYVSGQDPQLGGFVAKLSADGIPIWTFNESSVYSTDFAPVVLDSDGQVRAAGIYSGWDGGLLAIRLDQSTGVPMWEQTCPGVWPTTAVAPLVDGDGVMYAGGFDQSSPLIIRVSADGSSVTEWTGLQNNVVAGRLLPAGGEAFVTFPSNWGLPLTYSVTAFDQGGNQLFDQSYAFPQNGNPPVVSFASSGAHAMATFYSLGAPSDASYGLVAKFDPAGRWMWSRGVSPGPAERVELGDAVLTESGDVVAAFNRSSGQAVVNRYSDSPTTSVSGTVALEMFDGSVAGTATLEFRDPVRWEASTPLPIAIDSSGNFSTTGLPFGTWDISLKIGHWLRQTIPNFVVNGPVEVHFDLINGDLNEDNNVGMMDLSWVLLGWGAADGDLNGDGDTGFADLSIVLSNFRLHGDT